MAGGGDRPRLPAAAPAYDYAGTAPPRQPVDEDHIHRHGLEMRLSAPPCRAPETALS